MSQLQFLEEIKNHLKSRNIGLLGCTDEEVKKVEEFYCIKLPRAYVEYLLLMGRYSGPMNVGTSCFYDDLFDLREVAQEILDDNSIDYQLSKSEFVFEIHQGYTFLFFETNESDNSTVYGFSQNEDEEVLKLYDSYVDYWKAMMEYLDKILNKWNQWKK